MSRKKSKQRQAVPEEILAEGSGPVGEAAGEVKVEAEAKVEKAAKSRGKKKRGKEPEAVVEDAAVAATESDADADAMDASSDDAEPDADAMHASSDDAEPAADHGHDADEMIAANETEDSITTASAQDLASEDAGEPVLAASDEAAGDAKAGDEPAIAAGEGDDVVGEPITDEATVEAALLPGSLSPVQLRHLIEALIFATDKPVTLQRLRQLTRVSDVTRIEQALAELHEDYKDRGIALHQVSGGYQFRTNTAFSTWVQQLIQGRPVRLSRAQLETLAIVAYRQPITRPEIDEIRGVDSSATLRLLLDRSLIRVLGKREEVGRPTLYGTTKEFLDFFSLSDLRELPTLREYSELTAESRQVMSDRLGVPLDANGEPLEPEIDESLGEVDATGERDEASIVDSILAEHAAAEAEAEARLDARHEVGGDLAEAAMAGGSPAAFRDIFSDEPDPDAMMMSGEMSPAGSEARSYVDAIRAGALAESEPEMPHLVVPDDIAREAIEADLMSDELAVESSEAAAVSDAVELASEDLLAASEDLAAVVEEEVADLSTHPRTAEEPAEAHVGQRLDAATSDDVELRASEAAAEAHVGQRLDAAASDDVELRASEAAAEPHVGQTPDMESSDDVELSADEAAAEPHVGQTPDMEFSDDVELSAGEAAAEPHVGQTPDMEASDDVELSADEAAAELHVGQTPDMEASDDVELSAGEAAAEPHVGQTPDASTADEVELRADEALVEPHVGQTPDTSAADQLEASPDEAAHQPHVGPTPDDERAGDESVDETADSDDSDATN